MGIFTDILGMPIGWILKLSLMISGNSYIIALFFFALILQFLLFPLGIKQQKQSVKQSMLRPRESAIRKKYAGRSDRATQMKMQQEIQALHQAEKFSPFAGCLPMLIQLPVILVLFAVVRNPITYVLNLGGTQFNTVDLYESAQTMVFTARDELKTYASGADISGTEKEEVDKKIEYYESVLIQLGAKKNDDGVLEYSKENAKGAEGEYNVVKFATDEYDNMNEYLTEKGLEPVEYAFPSTLREKLPNFSLFGLSTLETPSLSQPSWLWVIVLLVFASSYFTGALTRKFSPLVTDPNAPNGAVPGGAMMKWGMPILSAFFCFSFSAAIGVYWIYRSFTGLAQQYVLSRLYPAPTFTKEDFEAAEKEVFAKNKKKKKIMIEVDEDDDSYDELISDGGGSDSGDEDSDDSKFIMLKPDVDYKDKNTKADDKNNSMIGKAPMKDDESSDKKDDGDNGSEA